MAAAEQTDPEIRFLRVLNADEHAEAVRGAAEEDEIMTVAREILDQLADMRTQLARMEGADYPARIVDHEARLRVLEAAHRARDGATDALHGWRLWALLGFAAVGAIGTVVRIFWGL